MAFEIKVGDRLPAFAVTLQANGAALPLTGAVAVRFRFRLEDAPVSATVDRAAVIVTPASGAVRYDWAIGDTATPGVYVSEWEVEWSEGKKQTFPSTGGASFRVNEKV